VSDAVVAVDVGGTGLKGALVGPGGVALTRLDAPTPVADGGEAVVAAIVALAERLAASAGPGVRVVGGAAVTPGSVDSAAGVVRFAANLAWRADVPLGDRLADALGVPCGIDHDVRAAGLAEAVYGQRADDCFFVALGTGIGSVLIGGGRARAGATGGAGEVGHIPVYPNGPVCACGQRGCLEVYASAAAIGRRYTEGGGASGTARDVVARLDTDPVAALVWTEAVQALALALATVTLVLDPGLVVIGGGLADAGDALLVPLRARLAGLLAWRPAPPVEASRLGTDAGWLGASLRAWAASGAGADVEAVAAAASLEVAG
jgi:glucokinase